MKLNNSFKEVFTLHECNLAINSSYLIASNAFDKPMRITPAHSFLSRDILHFSINDRRAY